MVEEYIKKDKIEYITGSYKQKSDYSEYEPGTDKTEERWVHKYSGMKYLTRKFIMSSKYYFLENNIVYLYPCIKIETTSGNFYEKYFDTDEQLTYFLVQNNLLENTLKI